jgi:outer membrane receptor protein involved in Fe transport
LNTGTFDTSGNPDYLFTNSTLSNLGSNITYNGTQICNCPLKQSEQEFQFVNNWTRTQGNHTIRFGGDIRYAMQLRSASDTNRTGVLNFNQTTTSLGATGAGGLDLATALLGYVSSFQHFVVFNDAAASRQKRLAFYGQDTWRVTPKFNLTYGLRWEMTFPQTVNAPGNGGFTNLSTGYVQVAGIGGIGTNGGENMDYKNLSPRVGLTYQVRPDTVIRAGGAIMYDAEGFYGTLFGTSLTENTPVYTTQDLVPASTNGSVLRWRPDQPVSLLQWFRPTD